MSFYTQILRYVSFIEKYLSTKIYTVTHNSPKLKIYTRTHNSPKENIWIAKRVYEEVIAHNLLISHFSKGCNAFYWLYLFYFLFYCSIIFFSLLLELKLINPHKVERKGSSGLTEGIERKINSFIFKIVYLMLV